MRGSTGCWWYKYPGRVQKYVLDHKPDLVIIGGISHRNDVESIREVIRQIQEASQPDILLMTGAFGSTDPGKDDQWQKISDPSRYSDYRKGLEKLAGEVGAAFLDMEAAWAKYVRDSGKDLASFKRDAVHANAQGEQILGHILANYLSYPPLAKQAPADQETDPLVWDKLDRFQDWKFGFMMHWGIYSQWGCIESWPLVEVDKWARPDDLPAWTERGKDFERFFRDYVALNKTFNPQKFDPTQVGRRRQGRRHEVRRLHDEAPRRLLHVRHEADRLPHDRPVLPLPHESEGGRRQGGLRHVPRRGLRHRRLLLEIRLAPSGLLVSRLAAPGPQRQLRHEQVPREMGHVRRFHAQHRRRS